MTVVGDVSATDADKDVGSTDKLILYTETVSETAGIGEVVLNVGSSSFSGVIVMLTVALAVFPAVSKQMREKP